MKLKISIGLSILVLACCVVAIAIPWYEIRHKDAAIISIQERGDVVVQYKWKQFTCKYGDNDKVEASYDDDLNTLGEAIAIRACVSAASVSPFSTDELSKILNSSLSFLIIGAALALGVTLLQIILLLSPKLCRSCIWKLLCIGCSIATVVMLFISFFTFLGAPKAFKEDAGGDNSILLSQCQDRWCDKILGDDDDYRWIPMGWFACLAGCALSLVSGLFCLASHR